MKRILTIQDISCFGKCSLTVALPILSAMGIETVILPTAVLSTHTLFKGFTCKDLSDQLQPITGHWKQEGITFDAICTGYLGTEEEIDTVTGIINTFRNDNTLVFVDPAMGDNGRLYPAFNEHYAKKNADLCRVADIIDPNITEAAFLTGLPYCEQYTEDEIRKMLLALADLGTKMPILTGVSLSEGKTGAMGYDTEKREFFSYQNDRIPAAYHGTGDIFSSVLAGAFVLGADRADALKIAADYTALTITKTLENPENPWYGVDFEETIPALIDALKQNRLQREHAQKTADSIALEPLSVPLSVCKVEDYSGIDPDQPFCFTGRTDEEKSLVCPTELVPANTISREDGWRAFRVCGELDFSLIGILAQISKILASNHIGIFAVSTYNTDYILTKADDFDRALAALKNSGYRVTDE